MLQGALRFATLGDVAHQSSHAARRTVWIAFDAGLRVQPQSPTTDQHHAVLEVVAAAGRDRRRHRPGNHRGVVRVQKADVVVDRECQAVIIELEQFTHFCRPIDIAADELQFPQPELGGALRLGEPCGVPLEQFLLLVTLGDIADDAREPDHRAVFAAHQIGLVVHPAHFTAGTH